MGCSLSRATRNVADAVRIGSTIEAAAAMESCLENWVHLPHMIKVDAQAQSISFQQAFGCVVISAHGRTCVKVVQAYALPPSFVPIRLARQVLPSTLTSHSSCYNF